MTGLRHSPVLRVSNLASDNLALGLGYGGIAEITRLTQAQQMGLMKLVAVMSVLSGGNKLANRCDHIDKL